MFWEMLHHVFSFVLYCGMFFTLHKASELEAVQGESPVKMWASRLIDSDYHAEKGSEGAVSMLSSSTCWIYRLLHDSIRISLEFMEARSVELKSFKSKQLIFQMAIITSFSLGKPRLIFILEGGFSKQLQQRQNNNQCFPTTASFLQL